MTTPAPFPAPGSFPGELHNPEIDGVTRTLAPSHILADGRFVHLPDPSDRDRVNFFERSIARHGLLADDINPAKKQEEEEKEKEKEKKEVKIHPLALASAKLQSDGVNELNRAINLNTLVATGEYFGLTNIVDPSLEISTDQQKPTEKEGAKPDAANTIAKPAAAMVEVEEEQRVKAMYVLKRKRAQFSNARDTLQRHRRRLAAAVVAQAQPDRRFRQLRPQWRLVAPEHGTRALPHATRPTEVIACDVDVYWKGRVLGRLASLVPRYATIELKHEYAVQKDLDEWENEYFSKKDEDDAMDVDESSEDKEASSDGMQVEDDNGVEKIESEEEDTAKVWTRAEPFAIADPALGKLDADFDPEKVAMLTLQFDIEKDSTGFCQSAHLEPMSTIAGSRKSASYEQDEKVLVALQHSLFCAKLFESIRRELAPDTKEVGQIRAAPTSSSAWLSSGSEENYLPPTNMMTGDTHTGLASLCVVHCHEGEVKVQLDCEYTLRVKLVEAGKETGMADVSAKNSGSQSPAQLLALCRTLLLHAQETYHSHSVKQEEKERIKLEEEKKKQIGHVLKKVDEQISPRILQSSVCLGCKILFERRIRKTLLTVNEWLESEMSESKEHLTIDWLSLSVFDFSSNFVVSFRSWSVDVHLVRDELTVTRFVDPSLGGYRKAKFHSCMEFELYLKMALKRVLKQKKPVAMDAS